MTNKAIPLVALAALAACSSGRPAAPGSATSPTSSAPHRVASLPENPCELLTPDEVAAATGLRIGGARRLPDIGEIVRAEREGRRARVKTICSYATPADIVDITIIVPGVEAQSSAAYFKEREAYFTADHGLPIGDLGEDAWLGGGSTLHVLAGKTAQFIVGTRVHQANSRDIVVAVARAVLSKLYK